MILGFRDIASSIDKELGKVISHRIEKILVQIKRNLLKEVLFLFISIISICFLSLSGAFFLMEFVVLNKTLSFLIIGIILLIMGFFIRLIK